MYIAYSNNILYYLLKSKPKHNGVRKHNFATDLKVPIVTSVGRLLAATGKKKGLKRLL